MVAVAGSFRQSGWEMVAQGRLRPVLHDLIDGIAGLSGAVLYLVALALSFGEAAILMDLFVPGEVGLVLVGAAGEQADTSLPALILLAAFGATAGDSVSYLLGRRFGTSLASRWGWSRRIIEPRLARAHESFKDGGGPAVFSARWVGALRALVPLVAGAAQMPYLRFLAWDLAAALGWSAVVVSLGWFLGGSVADAVDAVGGWLSLAVVALILGYVAYRKRDEIRKVLAARRHS